MKVQDGRIHIEKINGPFLYRDGGSPAEYGAGMKLAMARGWLWMHESGTFVKFTDAGSGAVRLTLIANPNGDSLCRRSTM
jgi:hypothetical protein